MTFSKKAILLSGILLCISVQLGAQVRQTREEYISRYMPIAIAHMERYGIPASITLAQPMEADAQITLCAITVGGLIPADAVFKVEVTNNGKDSSPVWEDATTEARNGRNHLFTNQTAANGFAFNFRVTAERGASGESGYIASIQGGFQ